MPEIRHMSFFKPIIYSGGDPSDLHDDPVKEQKVCTGSRPCRHQLTFARAALSGFLEEAGVQGPGPA
jgi:hypothetical protein